MAHERATQRNPPLVVDEFTDKRIPAARIDPDKSPD